MSLTYRLKRTGEVLLSSKFEEERPSVQTE